MKYNKTCAARLITLLCLALLAHAFAFAHVTSPTTDTRDHLTPQEADLVRAEQTIDRRTSVFIRAVERRLLVLKAPNAAASKSAPKDSDKLGELPTGTRAELFNDIAQILDEAITNIDDVAEREPKSALLPKSLRKLSEASTNLLPQLTALRAATQEEAERAALDQAIENAQSIINAAQKLPADTGKSKKEKGKS